MNAQPFSLSLSLDELDWLAGAMNLVALPLPADPYAGLSLAERRAGQRRGYQSLLQRGLLRSVEGKHQVEGLLPALLAWMTQAAATWQVREARRGASGRTLSLFALEGAAAPLWLEIGGDEAHFTLFPDRAGFRQRLQAWFDLPEGRAEPAPAVALPQPFTLIPLLWRNAAQGKQVLEEWGIRGAEAEATLDWSARLVRMIEIRFGQAAAEGRRDHALACSESAAWGGHADPDGRVRFEGRIASRPEQFFLFPKKKG